jgi:hypothetical protein
MAAFADSSLIREMARRTVLVDVKDPDCRDARSLGTGFVYKTGYVVACAHNREIDGVCMVNRRRGKLVHVDKKLDLMMIEVGTPNAEPLGFSVQYSVGDPVFFIGHLLKNLSKQLRNFFSPGHICAMSDKDVVTSAVFSAGCSGGWLIHVDTKQPIAIVYSSYETDSIEVAAAIAAEPVRGFIRECERKLEAANDYKQPKLSLVNAS